MAERRPSITSGCFTFLMVQFVNWKLRYCWQGVLSFIEQGELSAVNNGIAQIKRMPKALIKYLENKHLNPLPQRNWRRTYNNETLN